MAGLLLSTDGDTYGQSGLVVPAADPTGNTAVPIDLVSMYRNINYENVTKDHKKGKKPADDRNAQLGAIPGGGGSGSWKKSTRAFAQNLVGSPGKRHFKGAVAPIPASKVDRSKVIVNEIGNSSKIGQDWVEFRNLSEDKPYNLKNHHLSYVKKGADPLSTKPKEQETSLINFKDIDAWIPAGGVLLVLASDPLEESHPIAGGLNIKHEGVTWDATGEEYEIDDDTEHLPTGATSLYYVDAANTAGFDIPTDDTLIILRSADKLGTDANLLDVNGGLSLVNRTAAFATSLWPLKKMGKASDEFLKGTDKGRGFPVDGVYRSVLMMAVVPVNITGKKPVTPVSATSVLLLILLLMGVPPAMLTMLRKYTTKTPIIKCMLRRLLPSARLCIIPVETCRSGLSFTTTLSQTVSTLTVGSW